jgi:hypothetical protein
MKTVIILKSGGNMTNSKKALETAVQENTKLKKALDILKNKIVNIPKLLTTTLIVYNELALLLGYDKLTKEERDADARLTFTVTGEKARQVKKWGIYRIRFPERGTAVSSPVLYGMVCGKSGKKDERTLTLRVIRADNMELPNLDEPAWLVTDSDKVLEGKITAVTPAKKI